MKLHTLRDYCLSKKGTSEVYPFGDNILVLTVGEKSFVLVDVNSDPLSFNLKCDPDRAIELRERYPSVTPGYHMNKKHWNTIKADGLLTDPQIFELIDHSYDLVLGTISKRKRNELLTAD